MRGLKRLAVGLAAPGMIIGMLAAAPSALAIGPPMGCNSQSVSTPVRTNDARVVPLYAMCSGNAGSSASVSIVMPPAHGTLTGPSQTPLYTPSPGYTGSDQVTYRISNEAGASGDLTWPFQVTDSSGYAPQCFGVKPSYVRSDVPVRISLTCFDEDLKQVKMTIDTPPQHGTLSTITPAEFTPMATSLMPTEITSNATVMYTADPGYTGPDSFAFSGDNGYRGSMPATVTLNVASTTNHPPICTAFGTTIIGAGMPVSILATCADPDGDDVTINTTQGPSHGSIGQWTSNWFGPSSATYAPASGFVGADSIEIQATDANGASSAAKTIPLTVQDAPPAPNINCAARLLAVTRNVPLTTPPAPCFSLAGVATSMSISSAPSHGTASITPAGELRYAPDRNYIGPDTLTLHAVAGSATLDSVVVISVSSKAKVTILSGPPATSTDTTQAFSLYGEAGTTLTCALSNSSASTPTPCSGTKTYTDTPAGDHVLTVTAIDGQGRVSSDTYAFTVTATTPPASGGGGGGSGGGGAASGGSSATGKPDAAPATAQAPADTPAPAPATAPSQSAPAGPPAAAATDPLAALVATRLPLASLQKNGRAVITFSAPAAGKVSARWTVADPRALNGRVVVATATARVSRAGTVKVAVRLTDAGRKLLRHGRRVVRVEATATFRPDGAAATTRSATVGVR